MIYFGDALTKKCKIFWYFCIGTGITCCFVLFELFGTGCLLAVLSIQNKSHVCFTKLNFKIHSPEGVGGSRNTSSLSISGQFRDRRTSKSISWRRVSATYVPKFVQNCEVCWWKYQVAIERCDGKFNARILEKLYRSFHEVRCGPFGKMILSVKWYFLRCIGFFAEKSVSDDR